MLTVRQFLLGLFAFAAVLVDLCLLATLGNVGHSVHGTGGYSITGIALGQIGLIGIFLAWGPTNLLVRLGTALASLLLCSQVAAVAAREPVTKWYWSGLIYLLSVAVPLMMIRRLDEDYFRQRHGPKLLLISLLGLRRFTLAGLFSVTTCVAILMALFRWLDRLPHDLAKLAGNDVILAAVAWLTVWAVYKLKFTWQAVAVTVVSAPLLGLSLSRIGLFPDGPTNAATVTSVQAAWLLAGLLVARIAKPAESLTKSEERDADPLLIGSTVAAKSEFSPRIWGEAEQVR